MSAQCLAQKTLGCKEIALFAKHELDRKSTRLNSSHANHPLTSNLYVGLVHMPLTGYGALAPVEALQEHWRKAPYPAIERRMVDADSPLGHHFLKITQAQAVGQVPPHAQQNDGLIEVAAFEHCADPDWIALMPSKHC